MEGPWRGDHPVVDPREARLQRDLNVVEPGLCQRRCQPRLRQPASVRVHTHDLPQAIGVSDHIGQEGKQGGLPTRENDMGHTNVCQLVEHASPVIDGQRFHGEALRFVVAVGTSIVAGIGQGHVSLVRRAHRCAEDGQKLELRSQCTCRAAIPLGLQPCSQAIHRRRRADELRPAHTTILACQPLHGLGLWHPVEGQLDHGHSRRIQMNHVHDVNKEAPRAIRLDTQMHAPCPAIDVERVSIEARRHHHRRCWTESLSDGLKHVGPAGLDSHLISLLRVQGPVGSNVTQLSSLNLP